MKIDGNQLRPGYIIQYQGRLCAVVKTQHTQPGKGGAYMQAELRDIKNGTKFQDRFRASASVERVRLEEASYQLLYKQDDDLTFMHEETFDQITIPKNLVDEGEHPFLTEGLRVTLCSYEGDPVRIVLPASFALRVVEADPVVKGQTASSSYKPALLENNLRILVPPYIESGAMVLVGTHDHAYIERVNK